MSAFNKASAVSCVTDSARLSEAAFDIAGRCNTGEHEIESLALEVANLGSLLDQLRRFYDIDDWNAQPDCQDLASTTTRGLDRLFSELESYKSTLYTNAAAIDKIDCRDRKDTAFNVTELQYLRARVDSMRYNLLLMMTVQ